MDRNIKREMSLIRPYASLSARRAWIEIVWVTVVIVIVSVALRKESVDRNPRCPQKCLVGRVALRKESVDRNRAGLVTGSKHIVALRKESVDRNIS